MNRSAVRAFFTGFIIALVLVMAALIVYAVNWYAERRRIEAAGARYQAMYVTATPASTEAVALSERPGGGTDPNAGEAARPESASPSPTPAGPPSPSPEAALADEKGSDDSPTREPAAATPLPTPDADTLVLALPTPPPARESFSGLLATNPDTVGFLTLGNALALPVVQRLNDNEYYLDHSFEGAEAKEGALFLDGSNRLAPEDDCLIVYGHNMRNGTMFGVLHSYGSLAFLRANAAVRFDTLYEDRAYVPFAAFSASMDRNDARYFEARRFLLEGDAYDGFVAALKARSLFDIPVPVERGDPLLLLVTCDSTSRDGRFILALRGLRTGETEADVAAMLAGAHS